MFWFSVDAVAPDGANVPGAFHPGIAKQKNKKRKARARGSNQPLVHLPGFAQYLSNEKMAVCSGNQERQSQAREKGVRALSKIIALTKSAKSSGAARHITSNSSRCPAGSWDVGFAAAPLIHSVRRNMNWLRFFFSWKGRIGRTAHAVGWFINVLAGAGLYLTHTHIPESFRNLFIAIGAALIIFSVISLMARRYHDLDEALPVKIEVVEIPVFTAIRDFAEAMRIFTSAGNAKENKYGSPPKY